MTTTATTGVTTQRRHDAYETLLRRCEPLEPAVTAVAYPCEQTALTGAVWSFTSLWLVTFTGLTSSSKFFSRMMARLASGVVCEPVNWNVGTSLPILLKKGTTVSRTKRRSLERPYRIRSAQVRGVELTSASEALTC